jgi:uncharacterized membrane protein
MLGNDNLFPGFSGGTFAILMGCYLVAAGTDGWKTHVTQKLKDRDLQRYSSHFRRKWRFRTAWRIGELEN